VHRPVNRLITCRHQGEDDNRNNNDPMAISKTGGSLPNIPDMGFLVKAFVPA
jgi:hypothetical protein